ncbi:diaminobutyrate--2-oxoglutarate transaminase [Rhodopirellula sp. JC740]|uniref:Diaminobutyrate--2-oxoglutarate transaminase n=1 Tax=Rhodopirellula halodulae TaxID=2894198 RepID=A0ABS8NMP2_9BACT|nr:diaminobutyrate--2-oxoglutarate transaminase [Rhodopirellula sp. JC740]MCC9644838.1 diaminobutyrate--2-oxoglutarate transaminase [Rhodopirellula sp. JC740]
MSQSFQTSVSTATFDRLESEVRGYSRLFPNVFTSAVGSVMRTNDGRELIDFFCGAGSLNYGHNPPEVKRALIDYVSSDGILHSLDMITQAKERFLRTFDEVILQPRAMDYRLQFTGPTGTNAVEAALKLAKKRTQRSHIVAFTNGYHGHSLGSLSVTGNQSYHSEYFGSHNNVSFLPFDGYLGDFDTTILLEKMLSDRSSGLPLPAAVLLETVQGEGGIHVASDPWLQRVQSLCREHDVLLIVDDIQVGNGRTGEFFSFERAGLQPDMVCLSKSIGGGLPLSVLLMRPECDVWQPGQHTGTFRGNNLAFIAAAEVLQNWQNDDFVRGIQQRSDVLREFLSSLLWQSPQPNWDVRGRGMIWGLDVGDGKLARRIIDVAFKNGLLLEASGSQDEVLKFMPALNIPMPLLEEGLQRFGQSLRQAMASGTSPKTASASKKAANPVDCNGEVIS